MTDTSKMNRFVVLLLSLVQLSVLPAFFFMAHFLPGYWQDIDLDGPIGSNVGWDALVASCMIAIVLAVFASSACHSNPCTSKSFWWNVNMVAVDAVFASLLLMLVMVGMGKSGPLLFVFAPPVVYFLISVFVHHMECEQKDQQTNK